MTKFNLMSYLVPPEDVMFFNQFQESAKICNKTAILYNEVLKTGLTKESKEKILSYKKKGGISFKLTLKQLNKSFITPIEREDRAPLPDFPF